MIKNFTTGELYKDVAEAAMALGVHKKRIVDHLAGRYKHVHMNKLKSVRTLLPRKNRAVRKDLRKPIRCVETKRVYVSVTSAARMFKVTPSTISRHMTNRRQCPDVNGYRFEWVTPRLAHHNDLFGPVKHV